MHTPATHLFPLPVVREPVCWADDEHCGTRDTWRRTVGTYGGAAFFDAACARKDSGTSATPLVRRKKGAATDITDLSLRLVAATSGVSGFVSAR